MANGPGAVRPFLKSYHRWIDARYEFEWFKVSATSCVRPAVDRIRRFKPLEDEYSFFFHEASRDTFQISFGSRFTGRKSLARAETGRHLPEVGGQTERNNDIWQFDSWDTKEKIVSERGPSLVYSFGPTGLVAVFMYPSKSDFHSAPEALICLYIGYVSSLKLCKRLPSDLRSLVAYGYVTSIDGNPTLAEKIHIGWLRKIRPSSIDNNISIQSKFNPVVATIKFAISSLFVATLKPAAVVIVVLLLIHFGYQDLTLYLQQ